MISGNTNRKLYALIFVLVGVAAVGGYFFYRSHELKTQNAIAREFYLNRDAEQRKRWQQDKLRQKFVQKVNPRKTLPRRAGNE